MFHVYILRSLSSGRYYIGYSQHPEQRLLAHNSGKVASTKSHRPWQKVYSETFNDEISAIRREKEIKSKKSRVYIEWLIGQTRPDESRDGK